MKLSGKKIALLVEDGYNELEFWYPKIRMEEEGAEVLVVGPEKRTFIGKECMKATAQYTPKDLDPNDLDALIIPGGHAPDRLRRHEDILELVRKMDEMKKIIAFICHAGHVLISAGIVKGRKLTGFFSIKDDLINAGAVYLDEAVVVDENLISSRDPRDLPHFCRAIIEKLSV